MVTKCSGYLFISIRVELTVKVFVKENYQFLLNIENHFIVDVYCTYHCYTVSKRKHLKLLI